MSKTASVAAFYAVCVMILVFGVWWQFGVGWAAMVGGLIGALSMLFLPDVDEKAEERR